MRDVKKHIIICDLCQRKTASKEKKVLNLIWTNVLWQKICVDIIYIQLFEKKHYLIFVRKNFSKWMKNKVFVKADSKSVTRFIYENILCRHKCFERLMIDNDLKNKKLIKTFTQKYYIKRLIVSAFHSQVNEIIDRKYISIKMFFQNDHWKTNKNEFDIFIQYYELIELMLKNSLKWHCFESSLKQKSFCS